MPNEPLPERQMVGIAPFFFVADVAKAAAYYRDVLGFDYPHIWGDPPCFCMPEREGIIIMLSEVEDKSRIQPNGSDAGWDAYLWVRDADTLFEEFQAKGVQVVFEPVNRELYHMREFAVRDLDGYVLAFGSDLENQV